MSRMLSCLLVSMLVVSCSSTPSGPSEAAATIAIGPSGLSPAEVRIKAWGHVAFVNNDSRPHTIVSDPVDLHTGCPPINRVGTLQPGERRETGTLNLPGDCRFHDHDNQAEPALRGRIIVQ